jgi:hypothetical protein
MLQNYKYKLKVFSPDYLYTYMLSWKESFPGVRYMCIYRGVEQIMMNVYTQDKDIGIWTQKQNTHNLHNTHHTPHTPHTHHHQHHAYTHLRYKRITARVNTIVLWSRSRKEPKLFAGAGVITKFRLRLPALASGSGSRSGTEIPNFIFYHEIFMLRKCSCWVDKFN